MCITESHCCAAELKVTLKISHTSIQFKGVPWFSSLPVFFLLTSAPYFSLLRNQVLFWHPHNPNCIKNFSFILKYS